MSLQRTLVFINRPIKELAAAVGSEIIRNHVEDEDELYVFLGGDSEDTATFGLSAERCDTGDGGWTQLLHTDPSNMHAVAESFKMLGVSPADARSATDWNDTPLFDMEALTKAYEVSSQTTTLPGSGARRTQRSTALKPHNHWVIIDAKSFRLGPLVNQITAFFSELDSVREKIEQHVIVVNASGIVASNMREAQSLGGKKAIVGKLYSGFLRKHPMPRLLAKTILIDTLHKRDLSHKHLKNIHIFSGRNFGRVIPQLEGAEKLLIINGDRQLISQMHSRTHAEIVVGSAAGGNEMPAERARR